MPPHLPHKRLRKSPSPRGRAKASDEKPAAPRKATLYDDLDTASIPHSSKQINPLFQVIHGDDSDSSLTSLSDSDFEDVPLAKKQKVQASDGEDDDDVEFEDVQAPNEPIPDAPVTSGDLELTLNRDTRISLTNPFGEKKGPSKKDRKIRNATHCVHVLLLLWHNAVRNSWLCDPEVQAVMVSHIPPRLWDYIDRWRRNSGLVKGEAPSPKRNRRQPPTPTKSDKRQSRDWNDEALKLEDGEIDMSHGDPLFRLMQTLMSWWKQRFKVTTPGLHKVGYMSLERLDRLTKAYNMGPHDPAQFGEHFTELQEFRQCAYQCQGSRDVGAQLFTALLRGLGIEARMVASLQCLGFGWTKLEDADLEEDDGDTPGLSTPKMAKTPDKSITKGKQKPKAKAKAKPLPTKLETNSPISISSGLELDYVDTDDESVVELEVTPKKSSKPPQKIDGHLEYPHYWTEVLSPVTNKYLSVDPIAKGVVATNRELVESFEPRGSKADKARQVIAYVVGYSSDGTAKDVTVRYLKRQVLPGRTKGVRMPPEKIPIYNRHGKVKRYEYFDWFKAATSGYRRGDRKNPITEIDDLEDTTDLKSAQPEKKEVKEGEETLQHYKQSKEFVLERHLKREEALKPGSQSVKKFKNKAKGGKIEEEDVFLRSDVATVKSAETWHKQGRAPAAGEQPLKRVPYRAATLNRRREILETEAATGQKVLQGLYSYEQTEWIIPPPIQNGIIPKNDYGNIDLFVEHMCPAGAVHVPFRGAVRVCKRLKIDYAEAVVDFEFGHRMAVPVIQGVVIPEEYHDEVMQELQKDEAERIRKEDEKRRKAALGKWRKFIMGMRIVQRIRLEYGEINEDVSVFGHSHGNAPAGAPSTVNDEDMAGGFLPEGYEEDNGEEKPDVIPVTSFFPADHGDDDGDDDLVMENDGEEKAAVDAADLVKQEQLQQEEQEAEVAPVKSRRTRGQGKQSQPRKAVAEIEDSEEEEDGWQPSDDE